MTKSPSRRVDRDDTGLRPVRHRMRENALAAIRPPKQGRRHPIGRICHTWANRRRHLPSQDASHLPSPQAPRRRRSRRQRERSFSRRPASCENPPVASTTPLRAAIDRTPDEPMIRTPRTASPSISSCSTPVAEQDIDVSGQQRGVKPRRQRIAQMQRGASGRAKPLQRIVAKSGAASAASSGTNVRICEGAECLIG